MGSKLITQLLVEMDSLREALNSGFAQGMKVQRVTLIAATNVLEAIDAAFLQPGRFDRSIYIDLPNLENRKELFVRFSRHVSFPWNLTHECSSRVSRHRTSFNVKIKTGQRPWISKPSQRKPKILVPQKSSTCVNKRLY